MKKLSLILLLVVFYANSISFAVNGNMGLKPGYTPDGTEAKPYLIEDYTDFQQVTKGDYRHDNIKLECDLDLNPENQNLENRIIYNHYVIPGFSGTFDGNNHTIKNAVIHGLGFFTAIAEEASVKNLTLENIYINHALSNYNGYGAGFCMLNNGSIENCQVSGTVNGTNNSEASGFCHENAGNIYQCSFKGNVTAAGVGAGFCYENTGKITQSFFDGNITPSGWDNNISGFCYDSYNGFIENCYTKGNIGSVDGEYNLSARAFVFNSGYIPNNCYSAMKIINANMSSYIPFCQGQIYDNKYTSILNSEILELPVSPSQEVLGRSTNQMQDIETFQSLGWSFGDSGIWAMRSDVTDYPILKWQTKENDIFIDNKIDLKDFATLSQNWHKETYTNTEKYLVARWPLDNNGIDIVSGNAGTINGTVEWLPEQKVHSALKLSGNESITCGNFTGSLKPTERTITAWIYPTYLSYGSFISFGNPNEPESLWSIGVNKNGKLKIKSQDEYLLSYTYITTASGEMAIEGWQHIAVTLKQIDDFVQTKLYLNGNLENSITSDSFVDINSVPLEIGNCSAFEDENYRGMIDQISIYDYTMDINDIRLEMQNVFDKDDSRKLYMPFDGTIEDLASNHNITVHGNPEFTNSKDCQAIKIEENEYLEINNFNDVDFSDQNLEWTISFDIKLNPNKDTSILSWGDYPQNYIGVYLSSYITVTSPYKNFGILNALDSSWNNITITRKLNKMGIFNGMVYVNGKSGPLDNFNFVFAMPPEIKTLTICNNSNHINPEPVEIDNLCIYNRYVSPTEIQTQRFSFNRGDFNDDSLVDIADLSILTQKWLEGVE